MKAIFHPEAHEEMIESARFYEGRVEGLGSDFLTAAEETTRRIEQFPEAVPRESEHPEAIGIRFSIHDSLRNTA
jgi:hypothetical protein